MSHMSDAVQGVCAALDCCFTAYDDGRLVRASTHYPMDVAAIVDFSITARNFEVYGSLAVVTDIIDWSGVCFVADLSGRSKRWLEHGPIAVGAPEFARELAAACVDVPEIALICPPRSSIEAGFRFDLKAR